MKPKTFGTILLIGSSIGFILEWIAFPPDKLDFAVTFALGITAGIGIVLENMKLNNKEVK